MATDPAGGRSRRENTAGGSPLLFGLALTAGAVALLVLAPRVAAGDLPYPGCGLKHLTGLPCPGCGGVRGLAALARGNLGEALLLNPMLVAGCLLMLAGLPVALLDAFFSRGRLVRGVRRLLEHRHLGRAMIAVLAVNWVYLLVVGR